MDERVKMYFITVMEKDGSELDKYGWPDTGYDRTWGYYANKDDAIFALNNNITDMRETMYEYALLEEISEGICGNCKSRIFFKYDHEKNGYFEYPEPKELKGLCNFAIG